MRKILISASLFYLSSLHAMQYQTHQRDFTYFSEKYTALLDKIDDLNSRVEEFDQEFKLNDQIFKYLCDQSEDIYNKDFYHLCQAKDIDNLHPDILDPEIEQSKADLRATRDEFINMRTRIIWNLENIEKIQEHKDLITSMQHFLSDSKQKITSLLKNKERATTARLYRSLQQRDKKSSPFFMDILKTMQEKNETIAKMNEKMTQAIQQHKHQ